MVPVICVCGCATGVLPRNLGQERLQGTAYSDNRSDYLRAGGRELFDEVLGGSVRAWWAKATD